MIDQAIFHRAPLFQNQLAPLPLGAISPDGWLREELNHARDYARRLERIWPDVGADCGWLGGAGDDWERAPYYLDGVTPLAYLLRDEALLARVKSQIEWAFLSQREDGSFGPTNVDWWPRMLVIKSMIEYYSATGDARVPQFMLKYYAYMYKNIDESPLYEWAAARAGEDMRSVIWLYDLIGAKFLLELYKKLNVQVLDWTGHFIAFPFTQPMSRRTPWEKLRLGRSAEQKLTGLSPTYFGKEYHFSHVVNVAMGLKLPGARHAVSGGMRQAQALNAGLDKYMRYHGTANGIFTGDEHINGANPSQGTETCAVVELMYTMEALLNEFGGAQYGDWLEKLAFNALPATLTADQMGHQYLQQVNQVRCSVENRPWYNNGDDANTFGLEPNFGCCTANLGQGWPKFTRHLWMATREDGLAAISYAPCSLKWRISGTQVRIKVDTRYPFGEDIAITVTAKSPVDFPLKLRIPGWADGAKLTVNAEEIPVQAGTFVTVSRKWSGAESINLHLPMTPRITRWYHRSAAVELGPLLMALPIEAEWRAISDYPDYEVRPKSDWQYALAIDKPMEVIWGEAGALKSGAKHVKVRAKASKLPSWGMDDASAAPPPIEPRVDQDGLRDITLVPYGSTTLRIAQFPVARYL